MLRTHGVLTILTSKSLSRADVVQILSTSWAADPSQLPFFGPTFASLRSDKTMEKHSISRNSYPPKHLYSDNIDAARATGNFQYSRKLELLNFLWLYTIYKNKRMPTKTVEWQIDKLQDMSLFPLCLLLQSVAMQQNSGPPIFSVLRPASGKTVHRTLLPSLVPVGSCLWEYGLFSSQYQSHANHKPDSWRLIWRMTILLPFGSFGFWSFHIFSYPLSILSLMAFLTFPYAFASRLRGCSEFGCCHGQGLHCWAVFLRAGSSSVQIQGTKCHAIQGPRIFRYLTCFKTSFISPWLVCGLW